MNLRKQVFKHSSPGMACFSTLKTSFWRGLLVQVYTLYSYGRWGLLPPTAPPWLHGGRVRHRSAAIRQV